jgi:hypothetical protein
LFFRSMCLLVLMKSSASFAKIYDLSPSFYNHINECILSTKIMFLLRRTYPPPVSRSAVRAMSSSQPQSTVRFQFSAGEDEERLGCDAAALVTEGQGRWKLTNDNRGLERTFHFKTFKATWVRENCYKQSIVFPAGHSAFIELGTDSITRNS